MHSTLNLSVETVGMAMFSDSGSVSTSSTSGTTINNSNSDGITRYRILMLSEGIHNGLRVLREDIRQMIYNVQIDPNTIIPVVLDHSFNWNDVVGKITNTEYYDEYIMPDGKRVNGAAIADIELLPPSENTPKLNESLYRMEKLPELAKFSVAFKFVPITDSIGNTTVKELVLKHVAIVTNPADPSTGIIEKFSRHDPIDFKQNYRIDMTGMFNRGKIMSRKFTRRNARFSRRGARFNNPAIDTIARNALPYSGTYPIQDVSSIIMRPGQISPLGCGCGQELYDYQSQVDQPYDDLKAEAGFRSRRARLSRRANLSRRAKLARAQRLARMNRRSARFGARRPTARFGARRGARFTQYGVPTIYGNPWDYPISDTYPNVNQLISLKRRAAKLAQRRAARAKFASRRYGRRFDDEYSTYPTYDDGTPIIIQDGGYIDEYPTDVVEPVVYDDAAIGNVSVYDSDAPLQPVEPIIDAPVVEYPEVMDAPDVVDVVEQPDILDPVAIDASVDPVVEAYIEAGLIEPEEVEVVEETLARCRARKAKFAAARRARRAKFGSRRAKFGARRAKFGSRRAKFGARRAKFGSRRAKFDSGGLINDYLVPSANLPRNQNINIRDDETAQFGRRRARLSRNARRSGSFFADRGIEKVNLNQQQPPVPVQNTSIAPMNNAATTEPQTFVGGNTQKLLQELEDTKAALANSEKLSMLRAQALSMKMADKDFVMTLNENQLKRYIQTNGINTDSLSGVMNPFVSQQVNNSAKAQYIAEFADSFTKGSVTPIAATMDQIQKSAEQKAEQLFGDV